MLHRSGGNTSQRDRRVLFLRYADADAVEVYNDRKPRRAAPAVTAPKGQLVARNRLLPSPCSPARLAEPTESAPLGVTNDGALSSPLARFDRLGRLVSGTSRFPEVCAFEQEGFTAGNWWSS